MNIDLDDLKRAAENCRGGFARIDVNVRGNEIQLDGVSHRQGQVHPLATITPGKAMVIHTYLDGGVMSQILKEISFQGEVEVI